MTDQEIREAREWAEYINAVPNLHGGYLRQAQAAARFILDSTYPPLPDRLFGERATHPEWGEGIVFSHHPDEDGELRFMFPDEGSGDGTLGRWVSPSTLTFPTPDMSKNEAEIDTSTAHVDPIDTRPDHPVFLETEEDYASAPEGTIVAGSNAGPKVLVDGRWRHVYLGSADHDGMAGTRRRVLRWGWES